jgi:uncharacterized protein (DUF1501 family)
MAKMTDAEQRVETGARTLADLEAQLDEMRGRVIELEAETAESLETAKPGDLLKVAVKRAEANTGLEAARLVVDELERRAQAARARLDNARKALLREQSQGAQAEIDAVSLEIVDTHLVPMVEKMEELKALQEAFAIDYGFTPWIYLAANLRENLAGRIDAFRKEWAERH